MDGSSAVQIHKLVARLAGLMLLAFALAVTLFLLPTASNANMMSTVVAQASPTANPLGPVTSAGPTGDLQGKRRKPAGLQPAPRVVRPTTPVQPPVNSTTTDSTTTDSTTSTTDVAVMPSTLPRAGRIESSGLMLLIATVGSLLLASGTGVRLYIRRT